MTLTLTSSSFAADGPIPRRCTCEDQDLSPALNWSGAPAGTRSLVLIVDDPDAPDPAAPQLTWVHWVLFNIPGEVHGLPAGLDRSPELPNGARHGGCWGVDQCHRIGYQGPEPPPGQAHRYVFALTALDAPLELAPAVTPAELREAMRGHELATAQLTGLYARE